MTTPPRWKTTALTLLGVYPLSMLWPIILLPYIGSWPLAIRSLIIAAAIVLTLGYGLMPFLARWLHPWLHAGEKENINEPVFFEGLSFDQRYLRESNVTVYLTAEPYPPRD